MEQDVVNRVTRDIFESNYVYNPKILHPCRVVDKNYRHKRDKPDC